MPEDDGGSNVPSLNKAADLSAGLQFGESGQSSFYKYSEMIANVHISLLGQGKVKLHFANELVINMHNKHRSLVVI